MISSNTYLYFAGNCEEALNHYAETLGAEIGFIVRFDDTPKVSQLPSGMGNKIMHATLVIGKEKVLASDVPDGHYKTPQGFHLNVNIDEPLEADRIYARLADGGTKTMAMAETFWATRFGTCVDRFGIPWMVNCDKPRQ